MLLLLVFYENILQFQQIVNIIFNLSFLFIF